MKLVYSGYFRNINAYEKEGMEAGRQCCVQGASGRQ